VHVVNADAFPWVDSNTIASFIVIDFPDPTNYSLASFTPRRSYRAVSRHLSAQGIHVVQSTSPMFARDSFWCIAQTLKQAGCKSIPITSTSPRSRMGFVLAGTHGVRASRVAPRRIAFRQCGWPFQRFFQFPPDMAPLSMPTNQLNSQVLVRTYENEWKDISH